MAIVFAICGMIIQISDKKQNVKSKEELPENAKKYIARIEELVGVPVKFIGTGAGRENMIVAK